MSNESGEPAVGGVVAVEGGTPINQSYTMLESEEDSDEDDEASGDAAAAAEPAATALAAAEAVPA